MSHIVCPDCENSLTMDICEETNHEIMDGNLVCGCGANYPIKNGVPIFVTGDLGVMSATATAFSTQWQYRNKGFFDNKTIFGFTIEDYVNHFKYVFKLSDLTLLEGKVILEAGCGPGDMITSIGDKVPGAQLMGLDISDSIYQAAGKAVSMENVNFVKADLLKPPFRRNSFDYIFSAGVLHHTPDVSKSFKSLYTLLKPGGCLYIWLYPSYIFCAYDFTRRLIPGAWRLPSLARFVLSWALAPLLKLFFLITKLHSQKTSPESISTIAFRIFDNISPEFQSRHSKEEVAEWVLKLGASSYEIVNNLGVVIQK